MKRTVTVCGQEYTSAKSLAVAFYRGGMHEDSARVTAARYCGMSRPGVGSLWEALKLQLKREQAKKGGR